MDHLLVSLVCAGNAHLRGAPVPALSGQAASIPSVRGLRFVLWAAIRSFRRAG